MKHVLPAVTFFIISLVVAVYSPVARAELVLRLHNYLLPDRLLETQDSGYNRFLALVLQDLPIKMSMHYAPLARNTMNWSQDPGSCVFPASEDALRTEHWVKNTSPEMLSSSPIDYVSVYVFTRSDQAVIENIDSLEGKQVGHMVGSIAALLLPRDKVRLSAIGTDTQLIRMIEKNRLDAVMGFHPDLPIAVDRLARAQLSYDPSLILYRTATHFVCHDTANTRAFIEMINPRIIRLRQNGLAGQALGVHAQIVPVTQMELEAIRAN